VNLSSFETAITRSLAELGYRRTKKYVYRAQWSTVEVEHFLFMGTYGSPKEFLTLDFGFRNPPALSFAMRETRKYGGPLYSLIKYDEKNDVGGAYSLGSFAEWSLRGSLYLPDFSEDSLGLKLKLDVENKLFPVIRPLFSVMSLLEFLLVDAEPCPWYRTGAATRAAQIVHLARQVGWGEAEIRAALHPYEKAIVQSLPKAPDPGSFLDNVIRDSAMVGRTSSDSTL
jgi:hypothetical protein